MKPRKIFKLKNDEEEQSSATLLNQRIKNDVNWTLNDNLSVFAASSLQVKLHWHSGARRGGFSFLLYNSLESENSVTLQQ